MGWMDWAVLGAVAVAAGAAILYIVRRKKRCGGGCENCPLSGGCGNRREW